MSASAFLRRAAAITAVTAAALYSIPSAATAADDISTASAVITNAVISPENSERGDEVVLDYPDGETQRLGTELIGLRTDDGAALKTYCVEISTLVRGDAEMEEREWDEHPNSDTLFHQNRANILWILQNSYPVTTEADLAEAAGITGRFDARAAIAATQAAIWHYSDGVELADRANPNLAKAYEYLTGEGNVGIEDPPTPALSVTPQSLEGVAGEAIGPFVVSSSADAVDLAAELPEDVTLSVDGSPADAEEPVVTDGSELMFDVAEDAEAGAVEFGLSADAELNVGRLFVGEDYENRPTQSLILASSLPTHLEVMAELTWETAPVQETPTPTPTPEETPEETPTPTPTPEETPEETPEATPSPAPDDSETPTPAPEETDTPGDELPDTGVSLSGVAGAALLLMGAGAFVVTRRRAIAER